MIAVATASDAARLAALHARAFDKPWSAAELARLLDNDTAFAVMANHNGAEAGFALGWAAAGEAELLTVAVAPEARRQGVGAALVTAMGVTALVRGAASMHLEVAENNAPARALYIKLGYEEAGRRRDYYAGEGDKIDAIVMRRTLPRPIV
jgi:ribosomal-protein-alanine N-acetyltransferase